MQPMAAKPGPADGMIVPAVLKPHVPPPFQAAESGGMGQVMHHRFVVVDSNDAEPVDVAAASTLTEGGEQRHGDTLLASTSAAEASRLGDQVHSGRGWTRRRKQPMSAGGCFVASAVVGR